MIRWTFPRAVAVTVALGLLAASRIEGFPASLAVAVGVVALWRVAVGASGRALLRRRWRLVLGGLGAFVAVVLLGRLAGSSPAPLRTLLELLAVFEVLLLVAPLAPFTSFLLVLLSTVDVAGAGFRELNLLGLGMTVLWLVWLLFTLVLFERQTSGARPERVRGAVGRFRVGVPGLLPKGAAWRAVGGLAGIGFSIGLILYVLAPRVVPAGTRAGSARSAATAGAEGGAPARALRAGPGPASGQGVALGVLRLGDVSTVKRDPTPYFEVWLPPGRTVWLREKTYDEYRDGNWPSSRDGEGGAEVLHAGGDGWFDLGRVDDPVRGYDLEIVARRPLALPLCLARDPVRVRIQRDGRPLATLLRRSEHARVLSDVPLERGDVLDERAVPPVTDPMALEAARSDASVAPSAAVLHLPRACEPLLEVAQRVVGRETNPWRQALLLGAYFRSSTFTYSLKMPDVSSDRPVVDFVLEGHRGHCTYFASAMTLMLRALGHPARLAIGFRGGDWQKERGSWLVRGSNYHAWTEMYFDGVGWIPLDPTPPDRLAVDAETFTREAKARSVPRGARTVVDRFLGYDAEDRRRLAQAVGAFFHRWLVAPLSFLFGPRGWFAGFPLVLLLGLGLVRWRRRGGLSRRVDRRTGRTLPAGPYGRALAFLARRGLVRRRVETAGEFTCLVDRRLPAASESLRWLTRRYEEERFGGRPPERHTAGDVEWHLARIREAAATPRRPREVT